MTKFSEILMASLSVLALATGAANAANIPSGARPYAECSIVWYVAAVRLEENGDQAIANDTYKLVETTASKAIAKGYDPNEQATEVKEIYNKVLKYSNASLTEELKKCRSLDN